MIMTHRRTTKYAIIYMTSTFRLRKIQVILWSDLTHIFSLVYPFCKNVLPQVRYSCTPQLQIVLFNKICLFVGLTISKHIQCKLTHSMSTPAIFITTYIEWYGCLNEDKNTAVIQVSPLFVNLNRIWIIIEF